MSWPAPSYRTGREPARLVERSGGTFDGADILAGMFTANVGYAPPLPGTRRVYFNVDYASGDGQPGGDVGTFNQLYPLGHASLAAFIIRSGPGRDSDFVYAALQYTC